jgi:glutathione synthase/RimK-type ligase-like ATP-grasp enzyme
LQNYSDQKIVLKELVSSYGKGVFVGNGADYRGDLQFPLLAQEFIDTSNGVLNLAKSHHDVRVVLCDGEPIHGLLRQPPVDGLKATTVRDGASSIALFVKDLPAEVVALAKEIDARFIDKFEFNTKNSRLFAADFGYDGKEWKLFELNSNPGLAHESVDGPAANEYFGLLATKIVERAKA